MKTMNKNIRKAWSKVLRWTLGSLGITSIAFVFQACYAPYYDDDFDRCINGEVRSAQTHEPIKGIRITGNQQPGYEETDSAGAFHIHLPISHDYTLRLEDLTETSTAYLPKDTTIADSLYRGEKIIIYLDELKIES